MAMHIWPVFGSAVVLLDDEIEEFLNNVCRDDPYGVPNAREYASEEYTPHSCRYYESDDGDGFSFITDDASSLGFNRALVFFLERQPMLFEAAYKNMDEIRGEFKDLSRHFPRKFEWEKRVGVFSCSVCS